MKIQSITNLKNQKGQALVELALVLPVLLILVMGIAAFGQIVSEYVTVNNAARDGARYASVGYSDSSIVQIIASNISKDNLTITLSPSALNRVRGAQVTATVSYSVHVDIPIISAILPNPLRISAKSIMRVE